MDYNESLTIQEVSALQFSPELVKLLQYRAYLFSEQESCRQGGLWAKDSLEKARKEGYIYATKFQPSVEFLQRQIERDEKMELFYNSLAKQADEELRAALVQFAIQKYPRENLDEHLEREFRAKAIGAYNNSRKHLQ